MAAELVRILRDDFASALSLLDEKKTALDARVHAVRQRLKWIRSTLRVLQGALGEDARSARHDAAAAARLLSGARDADVAAASARVLSATVPDASAADFDRLADALDIEAAAAHSQKTPLGDVRRRLTAIAELATHFPTDFDGRSLLEEALKRAYKRGRHAMAHAGASRSTADLHAWRKETKHLWHLLRIARPLLAHDTTKMAKRFDELAEILGHDHDHAMLAERLAASRHDRGREARLAVIAERRRILMDDAFDRGGRLYARGSRAFAERYALTAG